MFGKALRLAAAATALAVSLTPAVAVTKHWRTHHTHHYAQHYTHHYYARGGQPYGGPVSPYSPDAPVYAGVPDRSGCVPQCRYDTSPCDPPYFKMADGRCNPAEHGGFF